MYKHIKSYANIVKSLWFFIDDVPTLCDLYIAFYIMAKAINNRKYSMLTDQNIWIHITEYIHLFIMHIHIQQDLHVQLVI